MDKRVIKRWVKQLEKSKVAIGKERDDLRNCISEFEDLQEVCDQAYDSINSAIDELSQLV